ncbi:MAG: hypothetical protein WCP35_21700 [Verrucomicrobiota bacterium]
MKKTFILLGLLVALLALVCVIHLRCGASSSGVDNALLPHSSRSGNPIVGGQSDQKTAQPPGVATTPEPTSKMCRDLVAGGRQWKLHFADKSLLPGTQQRINYDLNLVFGHMTTFVIDRLDKSLIAENGQELDRRVRFEGGTLRRPTALKSDDFGCLLRGGSESELYVPKSVTDAYLKSIKLEEQNKAILSQLDQFLARMSEIKERPIENIRELFVLADDIKNAEADLAAMPAASFAEGWGGKVYRSPSILDVSSTAGTPFEKYGSLLATTFAMSSGKLDDVMPLVFYHGQWRFLLQRLPS